MPAATSVRLSLPMRALTRLTSVHALRARRLSLIQSGATSGSGSVLSPVFDSTATARCCAAFVDAATATPSTIMYQGSRVVDAARVRRGDRRAERLAPLAAAATGSCGFRLTRSANAAFSPIDLLPRPA